MKTVVAVSDKNPEELRKNLPSWQSRGHKRGLMGWGEQRNKKSKKITLKKDAIPELCRAPVLKSVEKYFECIGVPPVASGVTAKQAKKMGIVVEACSSPSPKKGKRSPSRRQRLFPFTAVGEDPCDMQKPFLLVTASWYCTLLDPPVEDGSLAQESILGFFAQPKTVAKLMGLAWAQMHRCTNKVLFSSCLRPLHEWVRKGNRRVRLHMLQTLRPPADDWDCDDETEEEQDHVSLASDMAYEVLNALVLYAAGRPPSEENKHGFHPYHKEASWSSKAFKQVPTACLSLTFAEMYPYVHSPMDKWESLRKKRSIPMTSLWPWTVLRRHIKYFHMFNERREYLAQQYEEQEGEYHGPELVVPEAEDNTAHDEVSEESDDSLTLAFV